MNVAEAEILDDAESEPCLTKFIPFGYQCDVIEFLDTFDYSEYTPEIMLSGSVGSAKSCLLAHIIIVHCLTWPGACVAIGRKALPALKKTLFREILEHLTSGSHGPCLVERTHYNKKTSTAEITFMNGSRIQGISWADGNFYRFRSEKWSGLVIEELTENARDEDFAAGFMVMKARVGRIAGVDQNFVIGATNPDEPEGFIYEYFIEGSKTNSNRRVFYSLTRDNIHLLRQRPGYIRQLMRDYSVLEAERYLEGKWISIGGKGIYHAYAESRNLVATRFEPDKRHPLRLTFDFNVADGKPASCAVFQYIRGFWHFYGESVIDGAAWCLDNLEDLQANGYFEGFQKFFVYGDASGRAKSSNSLYSNYELIEGWFRQRNMICQLEVPRANPPLVTRWTTVNALCQNANKEVRLYVHETCPVLNTGMKLARKKPGTALEDDTKRYQHITTALGYACWYIKNFDSDTEPRVIQL